MSINWKLTLDGCSVFRTLADGTYESKLCSALEPAELAAALPADTPSLVEIQAAQCTIIDAAYDAAIGAHITHMGTSFQADAASRVILSESLTALGGTTPVGFYWCDVNNTKIPMTNAGLQGLAAAMFARGLPLFDQKQLRKAAIRAATTAAQVQAIVW